VSRKCDRNLAYFCILQIRHATAHGKCWRKAAYALFLKHISARLSRRQGDLYVTKEKVLKFNITKYCSKSAGLLPCLMWNLRNFFLCVWHVVTYGEPVGPKNVGRMKYVDPPSPPYLPHMLFAANGLCCRITKGWRYISLRSLYPLSNLFSPMSLVLIPPEF
jgi:hypothetical protein